MKARFVFEELGDLLKPKSQEEIDYVLNNDPDLLVKFGIEHKDLQRLFKGLKKEGFAQIDPEWKSSPSPEQMLARMLRQYRDKIKNNTLSTDEASKILIQSIKTDFLKLGKWALKNGAYVNYNKNPNKNTPLHFATRYQNIDFVKFLLKKGASVNRPNGDGYTPIMTALKPYDGTPNNKLEIFKKILKYDPNLNVKSNDGVTLNDLITSPNNRQVLYWLEENNLMDYSMEDISRIIEKGSIKAIKNLLKNKDLDFNKKQFFKHGKKVKAIDLIDVYSDSTAAGKMDYLISKGAKLTPYIKEEIYSFIDPSYNYSEYYQTEIKRMKKFAKKHNLIDDDF